MLVALLLIAVFVWPVESGSGVAPWRREYVPFNSLTLESIFKDKLPEEPTPSTKRAPTRWWEKIKKKKVIKPTPGPGNETRTPDPTGVTVYFSKESQELNPYDGNFEYLSTSPSKYFATMTTTKSPEVPMFLFTTDGTAGVERFKTQPAVVKPSFVPKATIEKVFTTPTTTTTTARTTTRATVGPSRTEWVFRDVDYTRWLFDLFYREIDRKGLIRMVRLSQIRRVFLNLLTAIGTVRNELLNKSMIKHYVTHFDRKIIDNRKRFNLRNSLRLEAEKMLDKIIVPYLDNFESSEEEIQSKLERPNLLEFGVTSTRSTLQTSQQYSNLYVNPIDTTTTTKRPTTKGTTYRPWDRNPTRKSVDQSPWFKIRTSKGTTYRPWFKTTNKQTWYSTATQKTTRRLPFSTTTTSTTTTTTAKTPWLKRQPPKGAIDTSINDLRNGIPIQTFVQSKFPAVVTMPSLEDSFVLEPMPVRVVGGVSRNSIKPEALKQTPDIPSHLMSRFKKKESLPMLERLVVIAETLLQKFTSNSDMQRVSIDSMSDRVRNLLIDTIKKSKFVFKRSKKHFKALLKQRNFLRENAQPVINNCKVKHT